MEFIVQYQTATGLRGAWKQRTLSEPAALQQRASARDRRQSGEKGSLPGGKKITAKPVTLGRHGLFNGSPEFFPGHRLQFVHSVSMPLNHVFHVQRCGVPIVSRAVAAAKRCVSGRLTMFSPHSPERSATSGWTMCQWSSITADVTGKLLCQMMNRSKLFVVIKKQDAQLPETGQSHEKPTKSLNIKPFYAILRPS